MTATTISSRFVATALMATLVFGAFTPTLASAATANLLPNPSVEVANSKGTLPVSWQQNHATRNTTTFTYPAAGYNSDRGVQVAVTSYRTSDEGWYFNDIPVTAGLVYTYADSYLSTSKSYLTVRFKLSNGSYVVQKPVSVAATAANTWGRAQLTFVAPARAVSVAILHGLESTGTLNTDDYSVALGTTPIPPTPAPTTPAVAPTINSFAATPASITSGQSARLAWSVTPTSTLSIAGIGAVTGTSTLVSPTVTTTYVLTAGNGLATSTASATVTVTTSGGGGGGSGTTTPVTAPTITSFTATPSSITAGNTSALVWNTSGATSITLDQGIGAVVGTTTVVAPTATTTYTLTAANTAGTTTAQVTVNVAPAPVVTPPNSTNLIPNPTFILNSTVGATTTPTSWQTGSFGAASGAVFTYPVTGQDDNFAASVTIGSYSATGLGQGAAEWYFNDVPVTGGQLYTFSDWYKSDTNNYLIAQWTLADNTVQYDAISTLAATSGAWQQASAFFSAPATAKSVTIFHQLQSAGTLTVDNYSLVKGLTSGQNPLAKAVVSLTFDDGLTSQYDNALPILKAANLLGTFYIITQNMKDASYDIFTDPNESVVTSPIIGGVQYSEIYTDPSNQSYRFSDNYTAADTSTITATFNNGSTTQTLTIGTAPAGTNAKASFVFTLPTNGGNTVTPIVIKHTSVAGVTASNPSLIEAGGYISGNMVLDLQAAGEDIGSHTVNHCDLQSILTNPASSQTGACANATTNSVQTEINASKTALQTLGVTTVATLGYPYGTYGAGVEPLVQSAGYSAARTIDVGYNTKTTDKYALKTESVVATTDFATVKSWIDTAVANNLWLVLVFHDVNSQTVLTTNGQVYGTTPEMLTQITNYLNAQQSGGNLLVKTLNAALPLAQ